MDALWQINLLAWGAGITAFFGALLAHFEGSAETTAKRRFVHMMIAIGGGILLAAVAFALMPEAQKHLSVVWVALCFLLGGTVFGAIDQWLERRGTEASQLVAMLLDFIPEALSLGAMFMVNPTFGWVLALFIALQNFPEGFNAFREMRESTYSARSRLALFAMIALLGPLAATLGYIVLSDQAAVTAVIMSFASGGILYLVFQDIAPKAVMRHHWTPPLGAVVGFVLGWLGNVLL